MFQSLFYGILDRILLKRSHHTPIPEDVFLVRRYLAKLVPLELTYLILEYAKYWPKASFNWRAHFWDRISIAVSSGGVPGSSTAFVCLATPKLRDWIGQGDGVRPKAIHFKIVSNDQGQCSDPNPPAGIYGGSWTWFEAVIIRDSGRWNENITGDGSTSHPLVERDLKPEYIATKVVSTVHPPYGDSELWHLQRNVRASSVAKTHEITWTDELDIGDEENPGYISDDTGRGRGVGFINSLQLDDRIAVIARAQYPGWENHIHDVAVELEYAI